MSLGSGVIPAWTVLMPYDQWKRGEITDAQLMEWLDDKKNGAPPLVIESWRTKLSKRKI